ncbi:MAG TPA: hypothetical protein VL068_00200 [Microthrixaceae bacterium]|nr:hypothetical protein [Microthrixaceae bacterium]
MAKNSDSDKLKFHEKVVAAVDMPGIPAGTPGRVSLINGFRWIRYRVYFENGVDKGSLDGSQLMRRKDWEAQAAAAAQAARDEAVGKVSGDV